MRSTVPSTAVPPRSLRSPAPAAPARVDIVVPVYNEQEVLARSIRRLHDHLCEHMPFSWRLVIADNASTDQTPQIAAALAADLPGVELLALGEKGRGRALRAAWLASRGEVVCYMDVDLSTDLRALLPLVAPLVSGHSDIAIGTRLHRGSHVVRGARREFISRSYNHILHMALGARFSDAQCGFKAMRAETARRLLPDVRDEAWFFDTELLMLAQREGLRIHEVPVDWTDDPDSRVDIVDTALEDLRGIVRLLASARLTRFLGIGVLSTLAYALIFVALRGSLGVAGANAVALALTTVANTQANRHFTFGLRGRELLLRHHAMGALVFALTLGLTSGALLVLHALDPSASHAVELTVLIVSGLCATVTRFIALRSWVFARRAQRALRSPVTAMAGIGG
jgi:glycosyltransferase involved in cell wall biosynthesis